MTPARPANAAAEEVADELGQLLEALGGSDALMLFQYDAGSGSYQYLQRLDAAAGEDAPAILERIRTLYPEGGRFQLKRHGRNPDTNRAGYIGGTPPFQIAAKPGHASTPEKKSSEVERLEAQVRELRELVSRPQQPQGLGMEAVVALAAQLTATQAPLLQALAERDRVDALQLLEVHREAFERGRDFSDNGGTRGDYDRVDALLGQALAALAGQAGKGQPAALPPAPEQTPTMAAPNPPEAQQHPPHVERIRKHVPDLIAAAKRRLPPELVAASIAPQLPAAELELIAADPVLLDDLIAAEPALGRYRSWAAELLECLAEGLEDGDAGDDEPETEAEGDGDES